MTSDTMITFIAGLITGLVSGGMLTVIGANIWRDYRAKKEWARAATGLQTVSTEEGAGAGASYFARDLVASAALAEARPVLLKDGDIVMLSGARAWQAPKGGGWWVFKGSRDPLRCVTCRKCKGSGRWEGVRSVRASRRTHDASHRCYACNGLGVVPPWVPPNIHQTP